MASILYKVAETEAELRGHFAVRQAVFVEEQGLFEGSDIDEHDGDAVHIVAVDGETGAVVGAVRCYYDGDGVWYGGRLAVLSRCRRWAGLIGCRLVRQAENAVRQRGCQRFVAYVQLQNVHFFQHLEWKSVGEPVLQYGKAHHLMEASLAAIPAAPRSLANV